MRARVQGMRLLSGRRRGVLAVLIAVAITGIAAISASAKSGHHAKPLSPALKAALSKNANQHVIVILKGQMRQAHVGSRSAAARMAQIRAAQAPVMAQLRSVHATRVKSYQLINAVSAT